MSKAIVTLVPKVREDYAEEHAKLAAEKEELESELRRLGGLGGVLNPAAWSRKGKAKKRMKYLEKVLPRLLAPPGLDLDPPRIGYDEKATEWYRAELQQSEAELPLPVDEMIDEAKGKPVWSLTDDPLLQQLGVEWPKQGFPVPVHPGMPREAAAALFGPMTPEQAVATGKAIQEGVAAYMTERYPELASGRLPEDDTDTAHGKARAQEVQLANEALTGAMWLSFWGRHGYAFTGMPAPAGT